jgi:hypothetical protein
MSELKANIDAQFLRLPFDVLNSFALRLLNIHEVRVLRRLEIEYVRKRGKENGKLIVTFADFEAYVVQRKEIGPALRVLQALGLIEQTYQGRGGNREYRSPHQWRITYLETWEGSKRCAATHDWVNVNSLRQAKALVEEHRAVDKRSRKRSGKRRRQVVAGIEAATTETR